MSDRPQSTSPTPPAATSSPPRPDPRHPSTWEPVSEREHPLREVFLSQVHPDYHSILAGPFELLFDLLMALGSADAPVFCGDTSLHAHIAASARDLRFTASHLRGGIVANAQGSTLTFEEESLCQFAAAFSFRLDTLTAELEAFLTTWQPAPKVAP